MDFDLSQTQNQTVSQILLISQTISIDLMFMARKSRFPGSLVIWREIYEFETKNTQEMLGNVVILGGKFYHVPGKSNIFAAMPMLVFIVPKKKCCSIHLDSTGTWVYIIFVSFLFVVSITFKSGLQNQWKLMDYLLYTSVTVAMITNWQREINLCIICNMQTGFHTGP